MSMLLGAPVSKLGMSILAGLALGLSLADQKVQLLLGDFQKYTKRYEASLQELNPDSLIALHRFAQDVLRILKTAPQQ